MKLEEFLKRLKSLQDTPPKPQTVRFRPGKMTRQTARQRAAAQYEVRADLVRQVRERLKG